jgi:type I restriction enzyme S subunit
VPAHWTVKPVKFLTQIVRGQFTHRPRNDPSLYDGTYPFVQTGDIARAKRYVTEYSQTLNDLGLAVSKQFPEGTLVMTIAANIGDMAVINFPACFPDSIVGFIPTARVDIDFLYYLFLAMKRELLATATLNTQLNLNVERIAAIDAVQPPVSEQRKIADYLDRACGEIDSLLFKVETVITRLTEYRAALITAAVTGQLDVR